MTQFEKDYKWAVDGLNVFNPKHTCRDLWKGDHSVNLLLLIAYAIFITFTGYTGLVLSLNLFAFAFFTYRFVLTLYGLRGDKTKDKMVEYSDDLPGYCVLLPMRNENLDVVKELIKNVDALNYPKDKLDVVMMVDEDDDFLEDITNMEKPDHFRIVSSTAAFPFTKPKVCNLGLRTTNAEFVTIYDAEDKPDPDQLLKVLYKFEQDPDISCVQCRLHFNNESNNLMTRFFNLEYLTWFGLTIQGLSRVQGEEGIIPLGGTSQHIRTKDLIEVGGWDAFNVTEDCDLGVRLVREGKRIVISDSYTDEVAVDDVARYIPQRTRWQLGFMVTYLNHMKDFPNVARELGSKRFFHFIFSILGNVLNPLITPLLVFIWIKSLFFAGEGETYLNWLPTVTLIGNYVLLVFTHMLSAFRLQGGKNALVALIQPVYYLLQVYTVYRALWKLIRDPFTWEKTEHIHTH